MHLFGSAEGPHMAHFHVRHNKGRVVLDWEVRNAGAIRWRVLRSEEGFAESADALPGSGQEVVNESEDTHLLDDGLDPKTHYFYTIFSREQDGTWQRQVEAKATPRRALSWIHPQAQDVADAHAAQASLVTQPNTAVPDAGPIVHLVLPGFGVH
jgi:hypothetical protein